MIITSKEASRVFVSIRFIILFQSVPELIDWKSTVVFNTKRIGASSINRHVKHNQTTSPECQYQAAA